MYANQHGARMSAFRFDVATGEKREVFKDISIHNWSLSPDAKLIAIVGTDPQRTVIQLHSTITQAMKEIRVTGRGALRNIDWAADGKSVFVTAANASRRHLLLRVSIDGHVTELIDDKDADICCAIPSPDGRALALEEMRMGPTIIWMRDLL